MTAPIPMQPSFGSLDPAIATAMIARQFRSPVDGGYNWGNRSFPPQNPAPGQQDHQYDPNGPNPAQPIGNQPLLPNVLPTPHQPPVLVPRNPVPLGNMSLQQLRTAMTQLHMQQMTARMQKHVAIHSGH